MSIIRTIHNPTILLRDLEISSEHAHYFEERDKEAGVHIANQGEDYSKRTGLYSFYVHLNGMTIQPEYVELCTIDLKGKYPKITARIVPKFDEFVNFGLPKDGDLISIFYRSTIDILKPLRLDFIITDIKNESDSSFVLFGVLNLPALFKDSSFFKDDTSLSTLIDISKELKLGFATNETKTNDSQKWLCATEPLDIFIDEVKSHSWKDERSFFDVYIDNYYTLNFVNVFKQLTYETDKKVNLGIYKFRDFIQTNDKVNIKISEDDLEYTTPVVLHNWKYNPSKENNISKIKILNSSSRISLEEGYRKYLHFYDYTLDEKIELLNEALTSNDVSEDLMPLKGHLFDEKWKENTRHIWGGISYSLPDHNVHPFYYQAEAHNYHNLKEIDKFKIEVTLDQINFNLTRYSIVPILWYEYGEIAKKLREVGKKYNTFSPEESVMNGMPYIINKFISGFYVIKGFDIDFIGPSSGNPAIIKQRLLLTRTEWPKDFIVTDAENKVVTNLTEK